MESYAEIATLLRLERERNAFSPSRIIAIIEQSKKSFNDACKRFAYPAAHITAVNAAYDADVEAIKEGRDISIGKYTHQGAFIDWKG